MPNHEPLNPPVHWELFTDEEQRAMQRLMDQGFYSELAAIPVLSLSPSKEAEVARIQAHCSPSVVGFESKVRKKLDKLVAEGKVSLDEPSVEAEWHQRLLQERAAWEKEQSEGKVKRSPGRPKKEEVKEVDK